MGLQVWQLKMLGQVGREPPPHCDPTDLADAVPESWYWKSSEAVAFEPGVGDHPCSRQGGSPVGGAPDLPALAGVRKIFPHAIKRRLARFRERVASATCSEGGHAGETGRKAGVGSPPDSK